MEKDSINYNDYNLLMITYDSIIENNKTELEDWFKDDIYNALGETNRVYSNIKNELRPRKYKIDVSKTEYEKIKNICNDVHQLMGTRKVNNSITTVWVETNNHNSFIMKLNKILRIKNRLIELKM